MEEMKNTDIDEDDAKARLQDLILFKDKESVRHKETIRQLQIELSKTKPETEDVCLSARSFCERDALRLRDETIMGQQKQIDMLTEENTSLHENVTNLETELKRLQMELLNKDVLSHKLEEKIVHQSNQMETMTQRIKKLKGQEDAVAVSMKQNAQLLQLLQQQETMINKINEEKSDLKERLTQINIAYKDLLGKSADSEATATIGSAETIRLKTEIQESKEYHDKLTKRLKNELKDLHQSIEDERLRNRDELELRRSEYYIIVNELDKLKISHQKSIDENDELKQRVEVLLKRVQETEIARHDARDELEQLESVRVNEGEQNDRLQDEITSDLYDASELIVKLRSELLSANQEIETKTKKIQDLQTKLQRTHINLASHQKELEKQHKRVYGLQKEITEQGRRRVEIGNASETLKVQLRHATEEITRMKQQVSEIMSNRNKNRDSSIEEIEKCRARKDRVVIAYVKASSSILDLSDIEMRDRLLRQIVTILRSNTGVNKLILRNNNLTDKGARALCALLRKGPVPTCCDMRGNAISAEAVRHMAKALERNKSINTVSVTTDGLIEASREEATNVIIDCRDGLTPEGGGLRMTARMKGSMRISTSAMNSPIEINAMNCQRTRDSTSSPRSKSRLRQAGLASISNYE